MKKENIILGFAVLTVLIGAAYAAPAFSVEREMPSSATAGSTVTVTLHILASNISSLGIIQSNLMEWNITDIGCGGSIHQLKKAACFNCFYGTTVEWLFWKGGIPPGDFDCNYELSIPQTAIGTYSIPGIYMNDSASWEIKGPSEITLNAPITLSDLIDLTNNWANNEASLDQVIQAINQWSSNA